MRKLSLTRFFGMAPSVSSHLLKDGYAVYAENTRLWNGALEAFKVSCPTKIQSKPCQVTAVPPCGVPQTITVKDGAVVYDDGQRVDPLAPTLEPAASVVLTDQEKSRRSAVTFRYTLIDSKGGESPPSLPTELIDAREGDKVLMENMPASKWRLYAYITKDTGESGKPESGMGEWVIVGDYSGSSKLIPYAITKWTLANGSLDPENYCNIPPVDCVAFLDSGYYVAWKYGERAIYVSERNDVTKWNRRSIYGTQSPIRGVVVSRETIYVATDSRAETFTIAQAQGLTGVQMQRGMSEEELPMLFNGNIGKALGGAVYASRFGLIALDQSGQYANMTNDIIHDADFAGIVRKHGITVRGYHVSADETGGWVYDLPDRINGQHEGGAFVYIDDKADGLGVSNGQPAFIQGNEAYEFDCGKCYKKAKWRSRIYRDNTYNRWAYIKIQGDNISEGIKIKLILDGKVKHELSLNNDEPCVLPSEVCGTDTQVEIELPASCKKISLTGVYLATSKMAFNATQS